MSECSHGDPPKSHVYPRRLQLIQVLKRFWVLGWQMPCKRYCAALRAGVERLYTSPLFKLWIKSLFESSLRKEIAILFFSFFSKWERLYLLCLRSWHFIHLSPLSFPWPCPRELLINSSSVEVSPSPFPSFALPCEHNVPFSFPRVTLHAVVSILPV